MITENQKRAIKEIASSLAWNKVWQYEDFGSGPVFVLEAGPGRTVSGWHLERLIEGIQVVLGLEQTFAIEGVEDIAPDTWVRMVPL